MATVKTMKRIIFCGGREFPRTLDDQQAIKRAFDALVSKHGTFVVVNGRARGADRACRLEARERNLPVEDHPADWDRFGKSAGFRRNEQMLASGVDGVVAFPGGRGTAGMIKIAQDAGIPVWRPFGQQVA